MPPAARVGDMHTCPMVTGVVPHVGGPVLPSGCPTVMIGMMPAARVTDMLVCVGPPDMIAKGSPTVMIGNLMAARMGDLTAHGGVIVMGFPTVMIGEVGAGSPVSATAGAPGAGVGGGGSTSAGSGSTAEASSPEPVDLRPPVRAFETAAKLGLPLVCKGPCAACGQM